MRFFQSKKMKMMRAQYEVVVCGGGLAGICAAMASARHGAKTCLIHDRPVLGGNSSSEIRVYPQGAANFHGYGRETGIISELLVSERAINHSDNRDYCQTNSLWDLVLYNALLQTPNLTFHLNTSLVHVELNAPETVTSVKARIQNAETELHISGQVFIDCTGDGVLCHLAGCEWRMGTEGRDEFGEAHAPDQASSDTMGSSIHFLARDMGHPIPFQAPDWAIPFSDPDFFYKKGRHIGRVESGYWWMEMSVPHHTIYDNETLRHELTRHVLGVWDWIKNRDPRTKDKAQNYALDWIGQVPGKRESRRIMGQYLMTEGDVVSRRVFSDEIAYGGWYLDLHKAGGLLADFSEQMALEGDKSAYMGKAFVPPYGIPLRILLAKNFNNVMMAGRHVSVTHACLGTTRVQGTTALLGQAAGTAAAVAIAKKISVSNTPTAAIGEIQQRLISDGCFLPNTREIDHWNLARQATIKASSEQHFSGCEADPSYRDEDKLTERRSQWIALGTGHLALIRVYLRNYKNTEQVLNAQVRPVKNIWDYRVMEISPLAKTQFRLTPKFEGWVAWPVGLGVENGFIPDSYLRLDIEANPGVAWCRAREIAPGQLSAYDLGAGSLRRFEDGVTLAFQVHPAQNCFRPENVTRGAARPHAHTNLWRSEVMGGKPQTLDFTWQAPVHFTKMALTFDGHLLRDYRLCPPFYRDPLMVKKFKVLSGMNGNWREIASVVNNERRRWDQRFLNGITTEKLRIVIEETHGDSRAALYEVRCEAS